MDLKSKLKLLLKKEGQGFQKKVQKVLSPSSSDLSTRISLVPQSVRLIPVARDPDEEIRAHPSDPEADEAVLSKIDPLFFTLESNFDPSLHELQNLPDPLDYDYLSKARDRIRTELTVVSKKVFQLILEKQCSYTGEIERIREIEDDLVAAIFTCKESRVDLAAAKQEFTIKSLGVLANYRKRQMCISLLKSLRTIETLQKTEVRLQELLAQEDFPGAMQLILECQQAALTYNHFNCIALLSKKLQDTLENAEEQLDVALTKVCLDFDEKHYGKLQKAYQLLGKTHTCVDQLLMHYASAIHNSAFSVVHGFAELCRVGQEFNIQKKQYQDLCVCLTQEIFIPCLVDLCKAMWKIIISYRKLLRWHEIHNKSKIESSEESDLSKEYVDQKLANGSSHVWQDIQTKIRTLLLSSDLTGFKIDDFMYILSIIHNLKNVGSEFCNSESESLQDCIRESSLRYFLRYHHSKLDELRIFLENEGWEICPVRSDFDIAKLAEFKFLKNDKTSPNIASVTSAESEEAKSLFDLYEDAGSPFEIAKEISEENIYAISERPTSAEKNQNEDGTYAEESDPEDENEEDSNSGPFITNTTLSILRVFGRYLNLMHLLTSIAYDVAVCMSQLFEYYFYTVFVFFAAENGEITIETIPNAQLRVALTRIRDKLIREASETLAPNGKIAQPFASPLIDLGNEDNLYGLATRIVASESSVYLAFQLDTLKPFIEHHIPPTNWESIAQLIDQAVIVSDGLRRPTYNGVSTRAIDYESIICSMEKVNWDVKELMSQHSTYVDVLLRALQIFSMKMENVSKQVIIPAQVHSIIWEQVFRLCCTAFVDGYSNAKKCSNAGRGLMQLDFTQFLSKFDKISPVSVKGFSTNYREFVENYVKAYYNPESVMEEWIPLHAEYTSKQMTTLINCAWQGNKRAKQRLLSIVEELEKERR